MSNTNFRLTTDNMCTSNSEFLGHPAVVELNASRPIYTDDPECVQQWLALYNYGGIHGIREAVKRTFQSVSSWGNCLQPVPVFLHTLLSVSSYATLALL